jgi:hypothetical protein
MQNNQDIKKIKIGVYQLVPQTNNTCKFVEKGYVKYGKNFDDELMNLDFLKTNEVKVSSNRVNFNDEVYFQFFKDNVASTYISSTTKIPVFHCSVMYQKKILMGNLFNIYLYFNIENAKSYKSFKDLLGTNLKGKFTLEIEFNDRKDNLPFEEFNNFEELVTDLTNILSNDLMSEIINEEMNKKDNDRVKQYGKVDDYKIPDKVLNFNDLIKKYEESHGNMEEIEKIYK